MCQSECVCDSDRDVCNNHRDRVSQTDRERERLSERDSVCVCVSDSV